MSLASVITPSRNWVTYWRDCSANVATDCAVPSDTSPTWAMAVTMPSNEVAMAAVNPASTVATPCTTRVTPFQAIFMASAAIPPAWPILSKFWLALLTNSAVLFAAASKSNDSTNSRIACALFSPNERTASWIFLNDSLLKPSCRAAPRSRACWAMGASNGSTSACFRLSHADVNASHAPLRLPPIWLAAPAAAPSALRNWPVYSSSPVLPSLMSARSPGPASVPNARIAALPLSPLFLIPSSTVPRSRLVIPNLFSS